MWQLTRLAAFALVVAMAAGALVASPTSGATARSDALATAAQLVSSESGSPEPADTEAAERPEGNAWVVGVVIFVVAAGLIVGGRWWVRNRVGRLRG